MGLKKLAIVSMVVVLPGAIWAQDVAGVINPAHGSHSTGLTATFQAFQASDAMPIRSMLTDWGGDFHPQAESVAWAIAQTHFAVRKDGWEVATFWRSQALVRASRDTWEVARQHQLRMGFDANRSYTLVYHLSGFESDGVRLGWQAAPRTLWGGSWRWATGVSLLRGRRMKIESAQGRALTLAANDLDLQVSHEIAGTEFDTSDPSQFNPFVSAPGGVSGQGHALDFGVVWKGENGVTVGTAINDAFGEIQWRNVPSRIAATASAAKSYDASGFVTFLPAATAFSQYGTVRQSLPLRWTVTAEYPCSPMISLAGAWSQVDQVAMPSVGLRKPFAGEGTARLDYDLRFHTLTLGLAWKGWQFGVRTEKTELANASGYGLNLSYTTDF